MKTVEEVMIKGLDYCGPVKTSNKGFFLYKLEKLMKEFPGVSNIFMQSNPRVPSDRTLMAIE